MKTATKPEVSQQQALQLVQHHFGPNTTIEQYSELSDGWFNAGYLLTLSDGQEMVLKIAPAADVPMLRYEKDIMRAEVELMKIVKHNTSLPIPAFLATDFSRTQLPSDYYFLEKLHGTPLDKVEKKISKPALTAIQEEKGVFLAGLHQLKGDAFGYPTEKGLPQTTSWKSAFEHMIANILEDASDYKVKLPYSIERINRIIDQNLPLLDAITEPALLHFDFWNGNIFVNGEPGKYHLEGVIDFERGMWGDPIAEFIVDLGIHPDELENSTMFHAYQQAAPKPLVIDEDTKRRIRLYKAYLGLIMVVECAPRQYPLPMNTWIKTWVFNNLKQNLKELER
jgi:aminoglycoside phosphotransferase (APT) family kinase protein